jgi:uncharacterized integral membrane protein (TIGR00698 family)
MLFALLLGLAMNFLSGDGPCAPGIDLMGRQVLRLGIALLGLRITVAQVAAIGWHPVIWTMLSVILTIAASMALARLMGFQSLFGLLSGAATAICGASAAPALSAVLPNHRMKERATLFTVVGISALSTLTMIVSPMLVHWVGLDAHAAGLFLGGTIHDVAQVVGAGYGMSRETGDVATLVKLLRIAMLLPVIVFTVMLTRAPGADGGDKGAERPPLLPRFALAFMALVAVNSTGWVPRTVTELADGLSRWCLVAAIAAIRMKTQLRELTNVGLKPVVLMVSKTLFLAILVLAIVRFGS